MSDEEAHRLVDSSAVKLAEHFGAVQIVVSRVLPNGQTKATFSGSGDWFARKGLCQEFVERDQADTLARSISPPPPPDEGETWKDAT